jgi:hypothetical protein
VEGSQVEYEINNAPVMSTDNGYEGEYDIEDDLEMEFENMDIEESNGEINGSSK